MLKIAIPCTYTATMMIKSNNYLLFVSPDIVSCWIFMKLVPLIRNFKKSIWLIHTHTNVEVLIR
jgi:hypothetical protein